MARQNLFFWGLLILAAGIQISQAGSIARQSNVNNDNDEIPTTPRPIDPPFGYQFSVVSNQLTKEPAVPAAKPVEEAEPVSKVKVSIGDTDDTEKSEEEEEEADDNDAPALGKRGSRLFNSRQGASCGYHRLRNGQYMTVQSSNFNTTHYKDLEACTWRFFGQHCTVKVSCPCFEVPASSDCIGDYLKITDTFSFSQKFCGETRPQGFYNSTTNNLKVRFRSDGQDGANGFFCYVRCTGPGKADPKVPAVSCPGSIATNPGECVDPNDADCKVPNIPPPVAPPGVRKFLNTNSIY